MFWRFQMDTLCNGDATKYKDIYEMEMFDFVDAMRIKEKKNRVQELMMNKKDSII